MVRGFKDPQYWTSEQIKIDQPKIVGFLDVNKVIELGLTTKWTTYKVFQAAKNKDLDYSEAHYLKSDTSLE